MRSGRNARSAPKQRHGGGWLRWVAVVALAAVASVVLLAIPVTAMARAYGVLPKTTATFASDTLVYGQQNQLIADLHPNGASRIPVKLDQISPIMRKAIVAIEDRYFWSAPSFDLARILKAALFDVLHHSAAQGASTIPEQLAKALYLHDNKSITYKVKEILYGQELSSKMSRGQILDEYLNDVYFGQGATGIDAAAETYFDIPASQLDLEQASLIAGLLPAPSYLDPITNPAAARLRQRTVLAAMVRSHDITKAQEKATEATAPVLASGSGASLDLAPYFVDAVQGWLAEHYGSNYATRGFRVYTSLDLALNNEAQTIVTNEINKDAAMHMTDGALVAIEPTTGDVVAWIGGAGPNVPGGQIDMVAQPREPGSTFKLFTYSEALTEHAITMTTPVLDEPLTLPTGGPGGGPYPVVNYESQYYGPVPVQVALGNSINVAAVRVELKAGIPNIVKLARSMGVTTLNNSPSSYGPSMTLGSYPVPLWEMTQAASAIATLGTLHPTRFVLKVTNPQGRTVYTAHQSPERVLSPQVSYIMNTILSRNSNRLLAFGPDTPLVLPGHTAAIKTGTSTNYLDNLAIGWTPNLIVGDWVGNANAAPMYGGGLNGISGAATIWNKFMTAALGTTNTGWYSPPAGLTAEQENGETDYYLPGTGPTYQILGGGTEYTNPNPSGQFQSNPNPSATPTPPAAAPTPTPAPTPPTGPPTPPPTASPPSGPAPPSSP